MLKLKFILLTLCLLLTNRMFGQTNAQFEHHIESSSLIVEAKVISQTVFEREGNLFTSYEMEIYKQFKGSNKNSVIKLVKVGGATENEGLIVFPSLDLGLEETGIFLLHPLSSMSDNSYRLTTPTRSFISTNYSEQMAYGANFSESHLNLDLLYSNLKRSTGQHYKKYKDIPQFSFIVNRSMVINSIDKLDVCAGCGEIITISGQGFLANKGDFGAVLFTNGNLSSTNNTLAGVNYVSWSDTEIQLVVPSNAGSGSIVVRNHSFQKSPKSVEQIHIEYNIMNTPRGFEIRLIDDESDGDFGYKFQFSNEAANNGVDFKSVPNAASIVYEAFSKFNSNEPKFAIYIDDSCPTVTNQKPSNDNVNLITFDNDLWDLDVMVGDNSEGAIYMRWIKCGDSEPEVVDIDMIIRRDGDPNLMLGEVKWNFSDTLAGSDAMDFHSVIMHQLGHAMLLGHVQDKDMLMHYDLGQGESKRKLTPYDSVAASWVHSHSKAYDPPMVNCLYQFSQIRNYGDYDSTYVCETILAIQAIELKVKKVNNDIVLNFDVIGENGFGSYEIYRKTRSTPYKLLDEIYAENEDPINSYRYEDKSIVKGVYFYKVVFLNDFGLLITSNEVKVNVNPNFNLQIIQNPIIDHQLRLQIPIGIKGLMYEIFDLEGKLRMVDKLKARIDIHNFEQGTYFIRIKDGGSDDVLKFIKM